MKLDLTGKSVLVTGGSRGIGRSIVEACAAALEKGAPVSLTYRPSKKQPVAMTMVLTELRADLDPPRVIGYQLPGRGRRDLRSDRILRVDPAGHDDDAERDPSP